MCSRLQSHVVDLPVYKESSQSVGLPDLVTALLFWEQSESRYTECGKGGKSFHPAGLKPQHSIQSCLQGNQSRFTADCCRSRSKNFSPAMLERQQGFDSLESMLSSQLDPIDWATYEPYLWSNEATFYQRAGTLFGILLQTQRLHTQVLASPCAV